MEMAITTRVFIFRICKFRAENTNISDVIFQNVGLLFLLYHTFHFPLKHNIFYSASTKIIFLLLAKAAPVGGIQLRLDSSRIYDLFYKSHLFHSERYN